MIDEWDELDELEARISLAQATDTDPETLQLLAQDYEPQLRRAIAQNTNTPPDLLLKFALSQDYGMQQALVENAAAPIGVLERLLISQYPEIRERAQHHPQQPADRDQRQKLVDNQPGIPAALLAQFADDPWEHVRCWIAQYPDTPAQVLERLVTDAKASVVAQVLRHPQGSESMLLRYVEFLRQNWQRSPKSKDQRPQVLKVIQHRACSEEVLSAILDMATHQTMDHHDSDPLQLAIAHSQHVTPKLLRVISQTHTLSDVAIALTEHPLTPYDVLMKLWTRLSQHRHRRDRHDPKSYRRWSICLRQIADHPNLSTADAAMIRDYLSHDT